jgi:AcrR family transcriptional regulator
VAVVLFVIGVGMGLAMAPATESIMGSLPPEKAGIGSAMNDTTREIGGALGVAILGSITNGIYRTQIESGPGFAQLEQVAPQVATAVKESVGGAAVAASQLPPALGEAITGQANQAFIDGLGRATVVGAAVACFGVLVALLWLPSRSTTAAEEGYDGLVDGAARALDSPDDHLDLARSTLEVLADAGLSSLSYNGIAARSGISTATLERVWTSRVDVVTESLRVMVDAHPVPDTGDLRADLRGYLRAIGADMSGSRARRVLGALIGEAGAHPELAISLRHHVLDPRRAELAARVAEGRGGTDRPQPPDLSSDAAVDELIGPVFHRAVIGGAAIDDDFVDSVVDGVLATRPAR